MEKTWFLSFRGCCTGMTRFRSKYYIVRAAEALYNFLPHDVLGQTPCLQKQRLVARLTVRLKQ